MIILLICLLSVSAFLSASETSLFSLSPPTIKSYRNSQNPRLQIIAKLLDRPQDLLVTILMLNILANLLIQNTVSMIFDSFSSWILSVLVPLCLTLIFGELLPKSIALPNHIGISYKVAPIIDVAAFLIQKIRGPLTKIISFLSRVIFCFFREEKEISADELRHVLKTSEQSGVLMPIESELIGGAVDLQNSTVKEHMRPREEIFFYDVQEPLSKLVNLFVQEKITRIPVCSGGVENLLGIITARNFFFHSSKDLLTLLKKPFYIPESTNAWTALKMLRQNKERVAMVVDEYGSISGLITQEDLSEAVLGEIVDLRDQSNLYTRSSADVIIASGKLELSEFKDLFSVSLKSSGNVVTLGGWLIEQLGDIPSVGTKYATDHFLFYVLAAEPNRIRRIYVRRLKK